MKKNLKLLIPFVIAALTFSVPQVAQGMEDLSKDAEQHNSIALKVHSSWIVTEDTTMPDYRQPSTSITFRSIRVLYNCPSKPIIERNSLASRRLWETESITERPGVTTSEEETDESNLISKINAKILDGNFTMLSELHFVVGKLEDVDKVGNILKSVINNIKDSGIKVETLQLGASPYRDVTLEESILDKYGSEAFCPSTVLPPEGQDLLNLVKKRGEELEIFQRELEDVIIKIDVNGNGTNPFIWN